MPFCQNCGTKIEDGVRFCTECGTKLDGVTPAAEQTYQPAAEQTYQPVGGQTYQPAAEQTYQPAAEQTYQPAAEQTYQPAAEQTYQPAGGQTYQPAAEQTYQPAAEQTYQPAAEQTYRPAAEQTYQPAGGQTYQPAAEQTYRADSGSGQGEYVPPVMQSSGRKPGRSGGKKKAGKRRGIILAAAAAVVVLVILLVTLLGGGGKDSDTAAYEGKYEGVSCVVSGMDLGAEGDWIQLKAKGKATVKLMGTEYQAKWTLDGEKITVKQGGDEFAGTLKDGVLEVDIAGALYTFRKEGSTAPAGSSGNAVEAPGKTGDPGEAPGKTSEQTCYLLVEIKTKDGSFDKEFIDSMGGGYILFHGDGTGEFNMLEDTGTFTYDDKTIRSGEDSMKYVIADTKLKISEQDGTIYIMEQTDTVPTLPPVSTDVPAAPSEEGIQAWAGDYYGYWAIDSVWDREEEWEWLEDGNYWDCCATLELDADGSGRLILWDEDFTKADPLCEVGITGSLTGNAARFVCEDGYFLDENLEHADWLFYTDATPYGDVLVIDGEYDDGANDFWYMIYLRPWGTDWADMEADGETIPYYHDDWYLPLIKQGVTSAPVGSVAE